MYGLSSLSYYILYICIWVKYAGRWRLTLTNTHKPKSMFLRTKFRPANSSLSNMIYIQMESKLIFASDWIWIVIEKKWHQITFFLIYLNNFELIFVLWCMAFLVWNCDIGIFITASYWRNWIKVLQYFPITNQISRHKTL